MSEKSNEEKPSKLSGFSRLKNFVSRGKEEQETRPIVERTMIRNKEEQAAHSAEIEAKLDELEKKGELPDYLIRQRAEEHAEREQRERLEQMKKDEETWYPTKEEQAEHDLEMLTELEKLEGQGGLNPTAQEVLNQLRAKRSTQ